MAQHCRTGGPSFFSVLVCIPGFTVWCWSTPQPQFPFRQFKGVSVNDFLHNHPVKNECLYGSLSTDQITKHGFLEVRFVAVLIGFHGNLENISRLCGDQAASSCSQNTHQVLAAIKETVSGLRETRKSSLSLSWRWRAFSPAPGCKLL